jgi:hypothetical protein
LTTGLRGERSHTGASRPATLRPSRSSRASFVYPESGHLFGSRCLATLLIFIVFARLPFK